MKKFGGVLGIALMALVLVLTPMGTSMADNQKGWYVGLFAGYVIPSDLELEPSGEPSRDISLDNSWNLGIKAGYIFPQVPYLAVEAEYNYMFKQDVDKQTVGDINLTGEDIKTQALMANLILRYPHEMFRPYIGFGIGWAWIDAKLTGTEVGTGDAVSRDESDNAWAWQLLAGVNFAFAKDWSADLGYRYLVAENFSVSPEGVDTDIKYKNSTITLGINYHF
ncbi:MAG TPA: porin family protein [Syntrophales bacterium]|jgi:opacity protein-like surface antigen|nr:porin family protein [Syntrophales bacterium]HRT60865.1 porin family protein [Syntrophales bacterium]